MHGSIQVFEIAFVFSLGFARERVKRCFLISNVSTGNITLSWTTGCGSRDLNWWIRHRTQLSWATLNQKLHKGGRCTILWESLSAKGHLWQYAAPHHSESSNWWEAFRNRNHNVKKRISNDIHLQWSRMFPRSMQENACVVRWNAAETDFCHKTFYCDLKTQKLDIHVHVWGWGGTCTGYPRIWCRNKC
jgi:hypothetical protein